MSETIDANNDIQLLIAELVDQVELEKPLIATIIQMSTTTPEKPEEIIDATGTSDTAEKIEVVISKEEPAEQKNEVEEPDYAQVPAESEDDAAQELAPTDSAIQVVHVLEAPQKAELVTIPLAHSEAEDHKVSSTLDLV